MNWLFRNGSTGRAQCALRRVASRFNNPEKQKLEYAAEVTHSTHLHGESVVNRIFPAIAVAAGITATAMSTAYAYEYNSHIRTDWNDVRQDRAAIARDERHIDEERQQLSDARRHARWAWLHGEIWAAHEASDNAREEAVELRGAEQSSIET